MTRALDIAVAGFALLVLSPVMMAVALAVLVCDGRPVFFHQTRAGKDGRAFDLLKFRTMTTGSKDPTTDADRITPLGRFLRATSLDELPSLINVLRGEMSLVGPRPLPIRYLDRYSPTQLRRHEVRPGITGLAQVRGRNAISWDERLALDVEYVDTRTLRLDLQILLATVRSVIRREGISANDHATMPEFTGPAS